VITNFVSLSSACCYPSLDPQQKVVLKVLTMTDDKTKQKAIEAAADIYGGWLVKPKLSTLNLFYLFMEKCYLLVFFLVGELNS